MLIGPGPGLGQVPQCRMMYYFRTRDKREGTGLFDEELKIFSENIVKLEPLQPSFSCYIVHLHLTEHSN